jgi:3',5'-nucleoside bisphosphate phosphatase
VHTVLSPCAEVEMIPPLIVEKAIEKQISIIAITDHNSSRNFAAVKKAAAGTSLTVLPGMELQTREEVHILCLFDTEDQIQEYQQIVDKLLPDFKNQPEHFGEQFIVDETGEFLAREDRMLLSSVNVSIEDAFRIVENLGGLFIPAHVNRKAYGLLANLGFVPTDIDIQAVEISRHLTPVAALLQFPQLEGFSIVQNGDVHRLDEFLGSLILKIENPTISEIKSALTISQNRSFFIETSDNTI